MEDVGGIVTALALLVAALALLLFAIRGVRRIEAKVGAMAVTVDGIDQAVNNTPGPKLIERVTQHGECLKATRKAVEELTAKADALATEMTTRCDALEQIVRNNHPDDFPEES